LAAVMIALYLFCKDTPTKDTLLIIQEAILVLVL